MTIAIKMTGDSAGQIETPAAAAAPPPPSVATPVASTGRNGLERFERIDVARTEIKISGTATVDTRDEVTVGLDDRLRVCGEFRVVKVLHYVDKDGAVVRQQIITPISDLDLVPWDSSNPLDDGILRAH